MRKESKYRERNHSVEGCRTQLWRTEGLPVRVEPGLKMAAESQTNKKPLYYKDLDLCSCVALPSRPSSWKIPLARAGLFTTREGYLRTLWLSLRSETSPPLQDVLFSLE